MPEIATFQRDFVAALDQGVPPTSPMRVYLNTLMLGAVDALTANFPVTAMILGDRVFEDHALSFARRYPPDTPVLALYGQGFAHWLAREPVQRELPYLSDVARCEELHTQSLHAADAPALEPHALESLRPDQLLSRKLRVHPAARFGWLATPAMEIWLAHQDELTAEIAPEWRASGALFTRPALHVEACSLDALAHRLLAGIRLGETLGGAAQAASLLFPDAAIGDCFGSLLARGAFVAFAS